MRLSLATKLAPVAFAIASLAVIPPSAPAQQPVPPLMADQTPMQDLVQCALSGDTETALKLIDAGADPNVGRPGGQRPLDAATAKGDAKFVKMLLSKGANPNLQDERTHEASLHLAAKNGHAEIVQLLIGARAEVDLPDWQGWTPLIHAGNATGSEVDDILLRAGADPNHQARDGETALSLARAANRDDLVKLLEAAGARADLGPPGEKELEQSALLIKAVKRKGVKDLEKALKDGTPVDARDEFGLTALLVAVEGKDVGATKVLLANGAKPNTVSFEGWTPLNLAALAGPKEMTEILIGAGADPNLRTLDGRTALNFAAFSGRCEVVDLLLAKGATPDITGYNKDLAAGLIAAAKKGCKTATELLLKAGADPDTRDESNRPVIDIAREGKHAEVVKLLESAPRKAK